MVGPAGLRRGYNINGLERSETVGIPDVSLCLSQSIVSEDSADKSKMRRPTTANGRPPNRKNIIVSTKNNLRAETEQGETALAAAMRAAMARKAVRS
jgi:hypothetical protein